MTLSEPPAGTSYAEHAIDVRGNARFSSGGCELRRGLGEWRVANDAGAVDAPPVELLTFTAGGAIDLVAGWQRTMGAVKITPHCRLRGVGDPVTQAPLPSPIPQAKDDL